MFVGVVLALAAAIAITLTIASGALNDTQPEQAASASNVEGQASVTDSGMALPAGVPEENRGYVIGDPDTAAVYVDVWADPQCPFCKVFHDAGDSIIDGGVAAGNAAAEHYFVGFLGEDSIAAGNAIGCAADAGAFERYVDTMYLNQPQQGEGGYPTELLLRFGELSQIEDMDAFEQCVQEETYAPYVQSLTEFMPQAGVQGTPTIRVDGEDIDISVVTIDEFTALVNNIDVAEVAAEREANQATQSEEPLPQE